MKKPTWNIWRIKSPWLRVPVAVTLAVGALAVYAVLLIFVVMVGAISGAGSGVRDGAAMWYKEMDFRMLWTMVSDWKRQ